MGDEAETDRESKRESERTSFTPLLVIVYFYAFQPLLLPLEICSWLHWAVCSQHSFLCRAVSGMVGLRGSVV